jgi:hypothetical protein
MDVAYVSAMAARWTSLSSGGGEFGTSTHSSTSPRAIDADRSRDANEPGNSLDADASARIPSACWSRTFHCG